MSIFGKIKDAIFGKKAEAKTVPTTPTPSTAPSGGAGWGSAAHKQGMSEVDVEQRLDGMEGADRLNWRTSIVDLMKLIGLESSLAERKELADELGYTGDKSDSASMNIWLHKQVIQKIRDNGGQLPTDL